MMPAALLMTSLPAVANTGIIVPVLASLDAGGTVNGTTAFLMCRGLFRCQITFLMIVPGLAL